MLPNDNFVVTDPTGYVSGAGAIYLYSPDGNKIGTPTGSQADDNVGSGGVVFLANGNYPRSNRRNVYPRAKGILGELGGSAPERFGHGG